MAGLGATLQTAKPKALAIGGFGGGSASVGNSGPDYSAILAEFAKGTQAGSGGASPAAPGAGGGAAGGTSPGGGTGIGTSNAATANPGIGYANSELKTLYSGGGNVDALGRQAAGDIRDDAESLRKASRDSAAARGVSGGSIEGKADSAIDRSVLQAQAKARVGIANDWERRKQGILSDYAGNAATDENLQAQQRTIGINQANLDFQVREADRNRDRNEYKDIFEIFGNMLLGGA